MNKLTRECLALSNTEKTRLISTLKESIETNPEDGNCRFAILHKAANEVIDGEILHRIRQRELVLGRTMVAYQLRTEGYTLQAVGRYLAMHHSTVVAMQEKMKDALKYPHIYINEIRLWKEFQEKVKEYENQMRS